MAGIIGFLGFWDQLSVQVMGRVSTTRVDLGVEGCPALSPETTNEPCLKSCA